MVDPHWQRVGEGREPVIGFAALSWAVILAWFVEHHCEAADEQVNVHDRPAHRVTSATSCSSFNRFHAVRPLQRCVPPVRREPQPACRRTGAGANPTRPARMLAEPSSWKCKILYQLDVGDVVVLLARLQCGDGILQPHWVNVDPTASQQRIHGRLR
jgi:hypothetical protein